MINYLQSTKIKCILGKPKDSTDKHQNTSRNNGCQYKLVTRYMICSKNYFATFLNIYSTLFTYYM